MGRPLPGYTVALIAADGTVGEEGEVCLDLARRPVGSWRNTSMIRR